ncbi:ADP-ribosylation factor GTPase-activating protein 2 [Geodia barretti]|uniref:ADP-ribosylation factor GTPase-activating protein 2 n=1 Tax=Geodia barretti TaxID=519541 RepID=A0AA35VXX0_GEOBA|nr:ADP-ribosylation factor GTPase-activating protein 2 [Geodia barretti]
MDMSTMSVSTTKTMTSSDVSDDVTDDSRQPTVQGLRSPSSTVPPASLKPEPKNSLITKRKAPAKKSGLGGARKGLGAQKIQKSFSEIEQEAEHLRRDQRAAEVLASPIGGEGPGEMGFRETKMADPNKARQAERLGMGVGRVGSQSHSAAASMATISQVGPVQTTQSRVDDLTAPRSSHKYSSYGAGNEDFFDSFYPPSYTDYSSSSGSSRGVTSGGSSRSFGKHSAFADSAGSEPKPSSKVSSFGSFQSGGSDSSRASRSSNRPSRGGRYSEEAQQRFSSAKSISSDQYFGRSSADDSVTTYIRTYLH